MQFEKVNAFVCPTYHAYAGIKNYKNCKKCKYNLAKMGVCMYPMLFWIKKKHLDL